MQINNCERCASIKIWLKGWKIAIEKNQSYNLQIWAISEFAIIFIGTDPSNIDTVISNLRKSMGDNLTGIIMELSGIEKLRKMMWDPVEY